MYVKPKNKDQNSMWLSFSDALVRYGSGLLEQDLGEAYKKAGISFRGQLQQNFVVLHETMILQDKVEKPKAGRTSQLANEGDVSSPRKRQREDVETESEPKSFKK